jgi:hypothetical protein
MTSGTWWKFDGYEVRDSCIRPTLGARLKEYDPWSNRDEATLLGQNSPSTYRELLELLPVLQRDPGYTALVQAANISFDLQFWRLQPIVLRPANEARLVAWCQKYGLLGLLPHRVHQITLAARLRALSAQEQREMVVAGIDLAMIPASLPRQVQFTRTAGAWYRNEDILSDVPSQVHIMHWPGSVLF